MNPTSYTSSIGPIDCTEDRRQTWNSHPSLSPPQNLGQDRERQARGTYAKLDNMQRCFRYTEMDANEAALVSLANYAMFAHH